MRAFIAIEIPDEIKSKLVDLQKELNEKFRKEIKFVEPENMHITLKFFPEINENDANLIKRTIEELDFEKFEISCKSVGVFPNENFIRVIWVGMESNDIKKIYLKLSEKLSENNLDEKSKGVNDFIGHLTIGRVKEKIDLKEFILKYKNTEFGKFIVTKNAVKVKKSELTPSGPIYTDL